MNKRMREILAKIEAKQALAKGYMEGENKDVEKAKAITGKKFLIKKKIFLKQKKRLIN